MKIILGTAQIGMNYGINNKLGKMPLPEVENLIRKAENYSINYIDTAINYGTSEKILGDYNVQNFNIITKLPLIPNNTIDIQDWVNNEIQGSLNRLKIKSIYCVLLHFPHQLMENIGNQLYISLLNMKKKGLIENIGISIYSPSELERIVPAFDIDIVQCPFNLFDRRIYETGWLDKLFKMKIKIYVRSIFLQGLLLSPNKIMKKFLPWKNLFDQYILWIIENDILPMQACIQFIKSYHMINGIIVGVDKSKHLDEIMKTFKENKKLFFPVFNSNDENLINPSLWEKL